MNAIANELCRDARGATFRTAETPASARELIVETHKRIAESMRLLQTAEHVLERDEVLYPPKQINGRWRW